jgi:hypothetical protein
MFSMFQVYDIAILFFLYDIYAVLITAKLSIGASATPTANELKICIWNEPAATFETPNRYAVVLPLL